MTWAAGHMLGSYQLQSPVGAGGMGEVWKARDTRLNRTVAIKRLKAEHSDRFDQEARAIAALNHPHICGSRGWVLREGRGTKRLPDGTHCRNLRPA